MSIVYMMMFTFLTVLVKRRAVSEYDVQEGESALEMTTFSTKASQENRLNVLNLRRRYDDKFIAYIMTFISALSLSNAVPFLNITSMKNSRARGASRIIENVPMKTPQR